MNFRVVVLSQSLVNARSVSKTLSHHISALIKGIWQWTFDTQVRQLLLQETHHRKCGSLLTWELSWLTSIASFLQMVAEVQDQVSEAVMLEAVVS
jgi:hypothetical protein